MLPIPAKSIKVLPDFKIQVDFECGVSKLLDVKKIVSKVPVLSPLVEDEVLFNQARLEDKYGIVWNSELDLAVESAWVDGITVE